MNILLITLEHFHVDVLTFLPTVPQSPSDQHHWRLVCQWTLCDLPHDLYVKTKN